MEELLGNYAISARRPQTSMGELRAIVRATALLGTARLGDTDCGPFKGRVLWWSRGSYVPEQAPQTTDSDGAAGRTGRRSSMTSEADHVGDTVTSDY